MQEIKYKVKMTIYENERFGRVDLTVPIIRTSEIVIVRPEELEPDDDPEDFACEWLEWYIRDREGIYHGEAHFYIDEYTEFDWLKENNAPRLPI